MNINIQGLSFGYRNHSVLDQINMEIPSGSLCTLLGSNGAGKTTLLKCISGILRPSSGSVFADNIDLLALQPGQRAKLIGYVPQNTQAENSSLNVMETVLSGRLPYKKGRLQQEDHEIALSAMEKLCLSGYALRELSQLSGGERQRVFIARAVAQRPQIMLLDEPTSNLDMHFQQETMEILKRLSAEQGITVLTILHDLNAAIAYADQVVLLKDGGIYRKDTPHKVLQKKEIEEIFRVKAAFAELDGVQYVVPRRHKK